MGDQSDKCPSARRVPARREGDSGHNRGASRGGAGCTPGWVLGVPLGAAVPRVARCDGRLAVLGCWRSWAGRSLPAHVTVPIPGSTPDPSHHTLAPPGPKGPVSAPTVSAWPCCTHHGTHHLLLALKDPS